MKCLTNFCLLWVLPLLLTRTALCLGNDSYELYPNEDNNNSPAENYYQQFGNTRVIDGLKEYRGFGDEYFQGKMHHVDGRDSLSEIPFSITANLGGGIKNGSKPSDDVHKNGSKPSDDPHKNGSKPNHDPHQPPPPQESYLMAVPDTGAYPPPYMITRANYNDTCTREAKYYFERQCSGCSPCCQAKYYWICFNAYRRHDKSIFTGRPVTVASSLKEGCKSCKPYHSYVVASLQCRHKILNSCSAFFLTRPPNWPPNDLRACCQMLYYKQYCLPAWNDQALYKLPTEYQEIRDVRCRRLMVENFRQHCIKYYLEEETHGLFGDAFTIEKNCTIPAQSKAEANHL